MQQRNIVSIFNLGDILYGPLFPLETYDLLKGMDIKSVSGNCDRILLQASSDNLTAQYVIDMLENEHKNWLNNLPFSIQTEDFYFCHASPKSDEQYLLHDITLNDAILKQPQDIMNLVKEIPQNIIFCGHSHLPDIVYLPNGKVIVNPGSFGLPAYEEEEPFYYKMESGTPFANYTIVEKRDGRWIFEQINITYDVTDEIKQSEKLNRPDWACALKFGHV
ncbi:YfcE family phosphodiesterase [Lysinibacillus sp. B2A1]|nr:YfcE family phosphodiesterase [Lysinibacillus sp. B2A1]